VAERFGHSKSSGAGGGDCGIAFICNNQFKRLHDAWIEEDILPLNLNVSQTGLIVTKMKV
jgi:phosphomevalonate kinase